jgi:hypothetical protein
VNRFTFLVLGTTNASGSKAGCHYIINTDCTIGIYHDPGVL